jgi:hypothetical protein
MIGPIRGCRSTTLLPALGHYKLIGINSACLPLAHACRLTLPLGYNVGPFEAVVRQLLCWRWAITSLSPTYMLWMIGPIRDCRSTTLLPELGHYKLIGINSACLPLAHACRLTLPLGYNVGPFETVVRQLLCWRSAIASLSPAYMLRMIGPIQGRRSTTLFPALGHYKLIGINHPLAHACRLAFPLGYNVGPFEAVVRQLLCWRWAITSLSPTYMLRMIGPIRGCRSTTLLPELGHYKLIGINSACLPLAHACRLTLPLGYNVGPFEVVVRQLLCWRSAITSISPAYML